MTLKNDIPVFDKDKYRVAMGELLVLYTQIDQLIMEVCAERIASAPDLSARLALGKQVGDESRHVSIQNDWMEQFGTATGPIISEAQQDSIRAYFRELDWLDFLADMYLCVEALGSEAVEKIVPLADPGTRESLAIPLSDELDHIAFGVGRLREELARLPLAERTAFLAGLEDRIKRLTRMFHGLGIDVAAMFAAVGADYQALCAAVVTRRRDILAEVATGLAA